MVQLTALTGRHGQSSVSVIAIGLEAVLAVLVLSGCGGSVGPADRAERGDHRFAENIVQTMVDKYAACRSYEDSGEVVSVINGRNKSERRLKFRTMFDRATGGFVFTFADADGTRGTIWRRPSDPVRSWWTVHPEVVEVPNISIALAQFTAISGGAASEIPSLIFRISTATNSARNFYRDPDESVRGVPCYKIVSSRGSDTSTLWIDKDSLVIRRTEFRSFIDPSGRVRDEGAAVGSAEDERQAFDLSSVYEIIDTTEYAPVFDRQLDKMKFDSKPHPL